VTALTASCAALAIILGGAFAGMGLRKLLPEHYLAADTKDAVKLGTGLIGTIAALVLGLLIAAANSSFDTQRGHVQHVAADIILLDQFLAQYGPEAKPAREALREAIDPLVQRIWRENRSGTAGQSAFEATRSGRDVAAIILQLAPQDEAQRIIKDRAIQATADLAQTRLLLFEQAGRTLPIPFLIVLIFWLAVIFVSFGMFARPNPVLVSAMIICAVSAAGALFLVLELSDPFAGLMQISSAPLRNALAPL